MVRLPVLLLSGIAAGLAFATVMAGGGEASAADLTATPETIDKVIGEAHAGQAVTLQPGDYPVLKITDHNWSPQIDIDASQASFPGIVLRGVSGVHILGGKIAEPTGTGYGVLVEASHDIVVKGFDITGARAGVVIGHSTDAKILDNIIHDNRSDGIDAPSNQRVTLSGNRCFDFHPLGPTYKPDGSLLKDGDHPDCIQIWSRPGEIAQDYEISGNSAEGSMQGISGFNHVRNGDDDGGFDRITVTHNTLTLSAPDGISLLSCRDCKVRNNKVMTIPGSVGGKPGRQFAVKTNVRITGERNVACGNDVPSAPRSPAAAPCF